MARSNGGKGTREPKEAQGSPSTEGKFVHTAEGKKVTELREHV